MVRVLVATALREAVRPAAVVAGRPSGALAQLCERRDRGVTAPPAPALGLCFAAVGGLSYADE